MEDHHRRIEQIFILTRLGRGIQQVIEMPEMPDTMKALLVERRLFSRGRGYPARAAQFKASIALLVA